MSYIYFLQNESFKIIFFFSTITCILGNTKTEFPHMQEEYTWIYIIQEKFHQQSQYHSLSYGKIEKLPEVENKNTTTMSQFQHKKTLSTMWASAWLCFLLKFHKNMKWQVKNPLIYRYMYCIMTRSVSK